MFQNKITVNVSKFRSSRDVYILLALFPKSASTSFSASLFMLCRYLDKSTIMDIENASTHSGINLRVRRWFALDLCWLSWVTKTIGEIVASSGGSVRSHLQFLFPVFNRSFLGPVTHICKQKVLEFSRTGVFNTFHINFKVHAFMESLKYLKIYYRFFKFN